MEVKLLIQHATKVVFCCSNFTPRKELSILTGYGGLMGLKIGLGTCWRRNSGDPAHRKHLPD